MEKQNQSQTNPKQRKTKTPKKETKQNKIDEGRTLKPRRRLVGKKNNRSKDRPIMHQIRPERAKLPQKGRPKEKQKQNGGKTNGRREAAEAWTSGK